MIFRPPRKSLPERIVLTLNRTKIYESPKLKYLGLILDSKLSWKEHINELTKKLNRSIGMLYKIRHYCPLSIRKTLYFSIFNSHLSYGLPVWGQANQNYLDRVKKIQKKAIRAITFSDYRAHTSPLLKKLEILNLTDLIKLKTASLLWDLNKGNLPASLTSYFTKANHTHGQNTRFAAQGFYKVHKDSISFQSIGTKMYNELNSKQAFAAKLNVFFLDS